MKRCLTAFFILFLVSFCIANVSSASRQLLKSPQKYYLLFIQDGKLYKLDTEIGKAYEIYIRAELDNGKTIMWLSFYNDYLYQGIESNVKVEQAWLSPDMKKILILCNAEKFLIETEKDSKLFLSINLLSDRNVIKSEITYSWIKERDLNIVSGKWSPDSEKFAYVCEYEELNSTEEKNYYLNIIPFFEGKTSKIDITSNQSIWYQWSNDSSLIAFDIDNKGNKALYVADYACENIKKISPDGLNVKSFLWSPYEDKLLFTGKNSKNYVVYIAFKDNDELEKIKEIECKDSDNAIPDICWLSENKILFVGCSAKSSNLSFYKIDIDNNDSLEIETEFNGIYYLKKHPNDEIVLFRGDKGYGKNIERNIYILNLKDNSITNLEPNADSVIQFLLSPTGEKLAFTAENTYFCVPNEIVFYLTMMDFPPIRGYFSITRPMHCLKLCSWSPDEKALLTNQFILTEDRNIIYFDDISIVGWFETSPVEVNLGNSIPNVVTTVSILAATLILSFILSRRVNLIQKGQV